MENGWAGIGRKGSPFGAFNGCASVISAILATLLAIRIGFSAVVVIAIALYLALPFFRIVSHGAELGLMRVSRLREF